MLTQTIIENLKKNSDFQALEKHIHTTVLSLVNFTDIDFTDKEKAAIEGQARKLAITKLEAILEPFYISEQPQTNKADEVKGRTGLS